MPLTEGKGGFCIPDSFLIREAVKEEITLELQRLAVCVVDDDVVGDVGIQSHLVVLGRRVHSDAAAGVVRYKVVRDRQHPRVLNKRQRLRSHHMN